jgi:hypothetical protein
MVESVAGVVLLFVLGSRVADLRYQERQHRSDGELPRQWETCVLNGGEYPGVAQQNKSDTGECRRHANPVKDRCQAASVSHLHAGPHSSSLDDNILHVFLIKSKSV